MASDVKKVKISEENVGNRVEWRFRTRVADTKYLVEKAKEKKKKKKIYNIGIKMYSILPQ